MSEEEKIDDDFDDVESYGSVVHNFDAEDEEADYQQRRWRLCFCF